MSMPANDSEALAGLHRQTFAAAGRQFRIEYQDSVGSTQALMEERCEKGRSLPGDVLLADAQHEGRGRQGRTWVSPPGVNLYFSMHLAIRAPLSHIVRVQFAAGCALQQTLQRLFPQGDIWLKWPNDIWWGEAKLAGLLQSVVRKDAEGQHTVLGVGLNVNASRELLPKGATSIFLESGQPMDRSALFISLLLAISEQERTWLGTPWHLLREAWKTAARFDRWLLLTQQTPEGEKTYYPEDLGDHGELLARTPEGALRRLLQTDPSLRIIRG